MLDDLSMNLLCSKETKIALECSVNQKSERRNVIEFWLQKALFQLPSKIFSLVEQKWIQFPHACLHTVVLFLYLLFHR